MSLNKAVLVTRGRWLAAAEPVPGGSGVLGQGCDGEQVPTRLGTSGCSEQGPPGYRGMLEPRWPQSSLAGAAFWEGLNGFHAKPCRAVEFSDLQAVFIAERRLAETWGHRDFAGTRAGAHQAGGHQHRLSRGRGSDRDPGVGGEPGTSWQPVGSRSLGDHPPR